MHFWAARLGFVNRYRAEAKEPTEKIADTGKMQNPNPKQAVRNNQKKIQSQERRRPVTSIVTVSTMRLHRGQNVVPTWLI